MKVAVIGATGSTGALVIDRLLARGHAVVAIGRSPAPAREPATTYTVKTGDLTSVDFLATAIDGCDGVISCLGQNRASKSLFAKRTSPADLLRNVARATIAAIGSDRHQRLIYLSAFGVGEDMPKHRMFFRLVLRLSSIHDAYVDHAAAEAAIKASTVAWTIVKPPGLTDAATDVRLIDKSAAWSSFESTSKTSLAAFLVECAEDPATVGRSITPGEP
ncbi:MAG: epimerase [Tardiphaga sp.]|uniref:NAD(P)-dependent oxidoreductase n=1 Tax=Tardiphaga sp. TaxID=1926292 RepID=UPI002634DFAC|nr:NAD(P)H-binding protein [Tardiphaga sp.]MDB5503544.1 epimerase [Tardiphaga sp.]